MQLSQKEASLLKDMKSEEKLCVDKYHKNAEAAKDPQLKNLFNKLATEEQKHYDLLTEMENGTVPTLSPSTGSESFTATYSGDSPDKENDCYLCSDLLTTEKHVSHLYDTGIFEFKDENARTLLNAIQKHEQGHGKAIYDYMSTNGMYS